MAWPVDVAAAWRFAARLEVYAGGAADPAAVKGSLPAKGLAMTMAEFNRRTGLGADPDIAPGREVFVITVHGTMSTDALPGKNGSTQHVYTDVFDAATGTLIEEGIGYDVLS